MLQRSSRQCAAWDIRRGFDLWRKKIVISVCVLALAGLISTWIFAGAVERENNRWLYDVTDSLVTEIVRQYPDVEEETIRQMTSDGVASQKESVLKKYGIEEDNFCRNEPVEISR